MSDSRLRRKDRELDAVVEKLFMLSPLLYRNVFGGSSQKPSINPINVQPRALWMLAKYGSLPTSEIGRRLGISSPNVTSLVDKLAEKGYVVRSPDSHDRRVVNVSITERGKQYFEEGRRSLKSVMRKNMAVLQPEEMAELSSALDVCQEMISKAGERPPRGHADNSMLYLRYS
jgi:DNA-binding MarR family transcriptional regulator